MYDKYAKLIKLVCPTALMITPIYAKNLKNISKAKFNTSKEDINCEPTWDWDSYFFGFQDSSVNRPKNRKS